jgi:streptogramin lyase
MPFHARCGFLWGAALVITLVVGCQTGRQLSTDGGSNTNAEIDAAATGGASGTPGAGGSRMSGVGGGSGGSVPVGSTGGTGVGGAAGSGNAGGAGGRIGVGGAGMGGIVGVGGAGIGGIIGVGGEIVSAHLTLADGTGGSVGGVVIGYDSSHVYLVGNSGAVASSPVSVSLSGNSAFSLAVPGAGDCVSGVTALLAGTNCTLHVRFAPIAVGAVTATLSVSAILGASPLPLTINNAGTKPPPGDIRQFPLPSGANSFGLTAGPDGNVWFTDSTGNKVGRITPAGAVTEFPILTAGGNPFGITTGPDGNLWFTELEGSRIGRITTAGVVSEFPTPTANTPLYGITTGPDGNLWFSAGPGGLGRCTTLGNITQFAANVNAVGIVTGSDHNLWLPNTGGTIIRSNTSGAIVQFMAPTANRLPNAITAGPDGSLWFANQNGGAIGRATTAGVVTEIAVTTSGTAAFGIVSGPDGNLWFTSAVDANVTRMTTAGAVTRFPTQSLPGAITVGPDGSIWFTASGFVGRIAL